MGSINRTSYFVLFDDEDRSPKYYYGECELLESKEEALEKVRALKKVRSGIIYHCNETITNTRVQ